MTAGPKDYPQRIVRAMDGLTFLVENVLSFSRLEKREPHSRYEMVKVRDLLERVCERLGEYSDKTYAHSITEQETVTIRADTALLELLFLNLARNALLYNRSEIPRVDFTVSCDEHVHILCIDNGVGIPTDEWEAIFDRFYRLPSAPAGGTGIGLAICRRIVELHGGNIRVVKSSPAGTEIEVKLSAMK